MRRPSTVSTIVVPPPYVHSTTAVPSSLPSVPRRNKQPGESYRSSMQIEREKIGNLLRDFLAAFQIQSKLIVIQGERLTHVETSHV